MDFVLVVVIAFFNIDLLPGLLLLPIATTDDCLFVVAVVAIHLWSVWIRMTHKRRDGTQTGSRKQRQIQYPESLDCL